MKLDGSLSAELRKMKKTGRLTKMKKTGRSKKMKKTGRQTGTTAMTMKKSYIPKMVLICKEKHSV